MGIQSTIDISRDSAIDRIKSVYQFILDHDYQSLEMWTFEPDYNIQEYVNNFEKMDLTYIEKWTNSILGKVMDKPYFRSSMFNNYNVHWSEEERN